MTTLTAHEALANAIDHHCLGRRGTSVETIAMDLVGLHNTSQASPYLSMRARLAGFARTDMERLLWDEWRLARFRAMRLTMFIFPHELLEIAAAATEPLSERLAARWLQDSGMTQQEFDRLADMVDRALADGPQTVRALRALLDLPREVDLPGVVSRMCDTGRLAGGRPPHSWRSNVRQYHRWVDVLPAVDLHRWCQQDAVTALIRRYIDSYGPVTVNDISWWTGISKGACREALERLGTDLDEVRVYDWPGPLYRLQTLTSPNDLGSGVAALPLLDPYVQGYRDRQRFLDPARTTYVYDGGGNAAATLVARGRIIGVWQFAQEPAPSVRYHLFDDQPARIRRAAEDELAAAGVLYFDHPVDVVALPKMKPLDAEGGRSASHPLDDRLHRASRRTRQT